MFSRRDKLAWLNWNLYWNFTVFIVINLPTRLAKMWWRIGVTNVCMSSKMTAVVPMVLVVPVVASGRAQLVNHQPLLRRSIKTLGLHIQVSHRSPRRGFEPIRPSDTGAANCPRHIVWRSNGTLPLPDQVISRPPLAIPAKVIVIVVVPNGNFRVSRISINAAELAWSRASAAQRSHTTGDSIIPPAMHNSLHSSPAAVIDLIAQCKVHSQGEDCLTTKGSLLNRQHANQVPGLGYDGVRVQTTAPQSA